MFTAPTARESWLHCIADVIARDYLNARSGWTLPPYKLSCGFPRGHRRPSQTWPPEQSDAGVYEIFISPVIADSLTAATLLVHELIHVAAQSPTQHTALFHEIARYIGLFGSPLRPRLGEPLRQALKLAIDTIGTYPHARLDPKLLRTQGTRLIKLVCACGMVVRTAKKWLDKPGFPSCACGGKFVLSN